MLAGLGPAPAATPAAGQRWATIAATVFHNYGRDHGLPHPVPISLAQDRAGFIWIGTQGGLARWDGYRFHSYKADRTVPGSLHDDLIQTLYVDRGGTLWVGGGGEGLARYDAARDNFVRIPLRPGRERTHIGAMVDDGAGGLWVGSDHGLHHVDPATGQAVPVPTTPVPAPVRALLNNGAGQLWVGSTRGLLRRPAGSRRFVPIAFPGEPPGVSALFEDGAGRLWIGTQRHGLFVIDRPGKLPRPIRGEPALSSATIAAIDATGDGEVWVALRGKGIVVVDTTTGRTRRVRHDRAVANSLAHDDVWALLRDNAGSIWAGTMGGLSYHPQTPGMIATVLGSQGGPRGLLADDPLSTLATSDGRLWVGYLDGGVDIVDPMIGRVAAIRPGAAGSDTVLPADIVLTMAEGENGDVYIGTHRGLYRTTLDARAVRLIPLPGRDRHATITALAFDAGILWVGTDEPGLIGLKPGAGGAHRVVFGSNGGSLPDSSVFVLLRGHRRDLWAGTRNGIYRIDLGSHAVEHIPAEPTRPTGLPGRFVPSLLIDRQGRLWAGTFGAGLAVMTGQDADGRPRFHRLGLAQGLPHLNVDSLEMDGTGTIWAGTDDGLARVDPASLRVRPVRQADGSALVDYFVGAGTSTPAGEAVFGAKGGLTIVRPGLLPDWTLQPPLVITDLRVGGVAMPIARFNLADNTEPVRLTRETNSLAVEFAALDFTEPDRNRYAYRLEGFDRDWIATDADRRLAVYTNLPPGRYTLRLRGSNRAGIWTGRERALAIEVVPAWYQRWWFRLGCIALLALAIAGIVRWRTAYLRRRQAGLERQIAERTADLRAANERLGQLAASDPLTGCANRRHFTARATEMIAAAHQDGTPLSLAILDLDEFKQINDRYGHPGGDAVLSVAGALIGRRAGADRPVGRMGGEEFALLLPGVALAEACGLAERVRAAVAETAVEAGGHSITATVSIGVAQLEAGEDFDRLYARADAALYRAKADGRNRVASSRPEPADRADAAEMPGRE